MSVQLIVYPQNYDGYNVNIFTNTSQFIINGNNFSTVNSSTDHTVTLSNGTQEAIDFYGASLTVNTWKRFHKGASGVSESGGLVTINPKSGQVQQGLIQKLSNLTVGNFYTITLDIDTNINTTNAFGIWIYSGTILQQVIPIPNNTGFVNISFIAFSTEDTIVIVGDSIIDQKLILNSISIRDAQPVPTGAIQLLGDGQVICDLYEDEDLPLTLSVDNFKNVAENVQSYSKAFKIPGTKRNSRIFDHIFEITREVASAGGLLFNPYQKTKAVLKQDGFLLFEGYLRMLDIIDKEGEISYNVNLYSEVIALADILQEKTFSDLDFTELAHDYNYTNIRNSWQGILPVAPLPSGSFAGNPGATTTDVLRYPFCDWNHQFSYTSSGMPKLTTLESAFRPFINIKYLINNIFADTDFTYESNFFNTADFNKLFMDFNWGSDNAPVVFNSSGLLTNLFDIGLGTSMATLPFDEIPAPFGDPLSANFGYSAGVFTAQEDGQVYTFSYDMEFNGAFDTLFVQWLVNGIPVDAATSTSISFPYSGSFTTPPLAAGDTVLCQAFSTLGLYDLDGVLNLFGTTPSLVTITTTSDQTTSDTLLETLRGELGQWDFLKGIITMFNLVTMPDEDNPLNIKIEPYADIFINSTDSIQLDWTKKVDVSQIKLIPLTDLNRKTIFKFVEDDDDYAFNQYKNLVGGHLYGSKKFMATDQFDILTGEEEIIAEPFAATVVKPLGAEFPELIVPSIYSFNFNDDTSEGFDNSPRIMYNNGVVDMTSTTYSVPAQNGVAGDALEDQYLQFSHLTDIPTITTIPPNLTDTIDYHFGECQLMTGVGAATVNNLFNMYWLPYFSQLYNPNTRIMTIKVDLSPSDINTFKFNDTVFIKNRVFRVNKIDYQPNELATVEFILIP